MLGKLRTMAIMAKRGARDVCGLEPPELVLHKVGRDDVIVPRLKEI